MSPEACQLYFSQLVAHVDDLGGHDALMAVEDAATDDEDLSTPDFFDFLGWIIDNRDRLLGQLEGLQ